MILIIDVCAEKLHRLEFVKPVEDILNGSDFTTKHYSEVTEKDLRGAGKIIICGTSLKDNKYVEDITKFKWVKNIEKPVLGICAGMQVIGMCFGGSLEKKTEIGFYEEEFHDFLGMRGKQQVYHLHNHYIDFNKLGEFAVFAGSIPQAVKHKQKELYGVLFHPEVRQKEMILNFVNF